MNSTTDQANHPAGAALHDAAVLVVDDSRTMRLGLIRALNNLGFRNITEAANGRQALELVQSKQFDLVLLDMEMPEMNGMEVLVALKADRDLSELPVIVVSAAEQMENAVKCIESGAEDFLPKPFDPILLRARVTTSLEKKRLRDLERQQLASELKVAREIQMGMVPHDFASFEHSYGVRFGAVLEPAREVGGDLYGVCAAGPERLVIFLGDVSGKGIAASMFMVRAISLARLLSRQIAEPEGILARLNDELAADNPSGMFVTFLCATFERNSGQMTFANAGHCRPILLPLNEPPRWAVKNLGTALGFEPGLTFERTELHLQGGDGLIFYSDGVSEAFNPEAECYGDARLLTEAAALSGQSATDITASLLRNVRAFAGTAPQSDDIAILAFKVASDGAKGTGSA
jgi:serine phosphatase RsbU (regulator of sigma subunit)